MEYIDDSLESLVKDALEKYFIGVDFNCEIGGYREDDICCVSEVEGCFWINNPNFPELRMRYAWDENGGSLAVQFGNLFTENAENIFSMMVLVIYERVCEYHRYSQIALEAGHNRKFFSNNFLKKVQFDIESMFEQLEGFKEQILVRKSA